MIQLAIEGRRDVGRYTVECECGSKWSGWGERDYTDHFSPALPIAEVVAHMQMEHPECRPDVRFGPLFRDWLIQHWELASFRQASLIYQPNPERV